MAKETKKDEITPIEPGASDIMPEEEPKTIEIPPELKEKSQEELARLLQETRKQFDDTKKKLGEQGQDLGERLKTMEDRLEYYRRGEEDRQRLYDMYNQPATQSPQSQGPQTPGFNYEDPDGSITKILDARDRQRQEQMRVMARQAAVKEGSAAYRQGRDLAYRQEPELYRGIERDVEQRIYDTYSWLAEKGTSVKDYVGNPGIWKKAAQNIRLEREEYNHLIPRKSPPMSATSTETPQPAKMSSSELPGQFDLSVNDKDMQAFDRALELEAGVKMTPEERKKILKEEQERFARGERY